MVDNYGWPLTSVKQMMSELTSETKSMQEHRTWIEEGEMTERWQRQRQLTINKNKINKTKTKVEPVVHYQGIVS